MFRKLNFDNFAEPRGGNQDDFELVLKAYYEKNLDKYHGHAMEPSRDTKKKGAAFLAVSRGKVRYFIIYFESMTKQTSY